MKDTKTGAREWSDHSFNVQTGCEYGCRYCYACANAVRFKRVKDYAEWTQPRLLPERLEQAGRLRKGRIMFPTAHDITPANVELCREALRRMLAAGNEVLVVSKADPLCMATLMPLLRQYREQVEVRVTVGWLHSNLAETWEPNAPSFYSRYESARMCFNEGITISVSCEPLLDFREFPHIEIAFGRSSSIWIGVMNQPRARARACGMDPNDLAIEAILHGQTPERVMQFYRHWKNDKRIRWKDSIRKILERAEA